MTLYHKVLDQVLILLRYSDSLSRFVALKEPISKEYTSSTLRIINYIAMPNSFCWATILFSSKVSFSTLQEQRRLSPFRIACRI